MKPFKIIASLFIIISLTGCVGQQEINIDEFLKKYNLVSNEALDSSMFNIFEDGNYIYSMIHDQNLICIYSDENGNIVQCTVTSKSPTNANFDKLCIDIICAFTDFDKEKSSEFYKCGGTSERYKLFINDYEIGKTMILNFKTNEINNNNYPTLKRYVNEDDIARPTLTNNDKTIHDN